MNSFDLYGCGSELRKRYTVRLWLICLEVSGKVFEVVRRGGGALPEGRICLGETRD